MSISIIAPENKENTATGDGDGDKRALAVAPVSSVEGQRFQLGVALPTAGSLKATVTTSPADLPAGDGYTIEVRGVA